MSVASRVWCVLAVICFVLSPVTARAQTGTIAGTIVEDGTLTPLVGNDAFVVNAIAYTLDGEFFAGGNTDATGHYQIPNLPPGSYYLRAQDGSRDHIRELYDSISCVADDCPVTSGTVVVVTAGATTTIDFSLAKAGAITGTVRRAVDNSPISSVIVKVYNASTSFVTSVFTATNGTYTVKGLATGSYLAQATLFPDPFLPIDFITELYGGAPCHHLSPASDCRIASSAPIAVTAGSTTSAIDFSLDKGATIAGTVIADGTGTPLQNVFVAAYAGEVQMRTTWTDAAGHYTITGVLPGRYRVRTFAGRGTEESPNPNEMYVDEWQNGLCVGCSGTHATVAINPGQAITGIDFSLAVGGTITGAVVCNTQNFPTAFSYRPSIDVYSSTGQLVRTSTDQVSTCSSTSAVPYTVKGLPTGTYFLWARDTPLIPTGVKLNGGFFVDQLYGGMSCNTVDCDVRKGAPVPVTAGSTTANINFTVQPGGSIPVFGQNAIYKIYDARGIEVINAVGLSFAVVEQPLIAGLSPGTYYVTRNGVLNGGVSCSDCPPTAGIPLVVGPSGNAASPTFTTPPRRISGTITNASGGTPLSTVTVELVSRAGEVVASAISDQFGHYTVTGLAAGTYFARTVNDRGLVDEIYMDAGCGTCDARIGTPLVVSSATDLTGIDFVLASGGIVSGLVSDTVGVVLGDVPVSLFAGTTTFAGVKTTSPTGYYRATLSAGTYRALAEATTAKGSEVYSEMPCTSAGCDPSTGTPIAVATSATTDGINFTLSSCSALTLSPPILATGVIGRAYRQVLSATGGTGPYAFDVTTGALPAGVSLNAATGVLAGTPTAAGRSSFRVSALDSNGCAADRSYILDVQACAFTFSPSSATVSPAGGPVVITIADACGSQEVIEGIQWIGVQSNTPGQVTLAVEPNTLTTPRSASVAIGRRSFEVRQGGIGSQAPFGALDLPLEGAQVSGAVAIGGWALDDLEVTRVRIYRDNVAGEPVGPIFIGNAVFVPGARPDVQLAYPNVSRSDRAGFGFVILTNTLPNQGNGNFRILVFADDAEGHVTLLGTRTIVGNNATAQQPFGTIDTPLQGETIAGASYVNFGWALTPRPAMIPTDGSTIQILIDGASIGTANYNFFRPDVSNAFPGLANSAGPVGHKTFDTTALAEGLHTISWLVTDSRPATSGLGSRYFNVANSADAQPAASGNVTATETTAEATDIAKPLGAAPAPDLGRRAQSFSTSSNAVASPDTSSASGVLVQRGDGPKRRLRVSDEGTGELALAPLERLELALGAADDTCPSTWAGYLVKDDVLSDLPVGASVDPAGTFYWQAGPGFAGRFPLVFVRTDCRGQKQRVPVVVTIPIQ
jgi:putative Ig domain-containing protein/carboxypeptidase family protein